MYHFEVFTQKNHAPITLTAESKMPSLSFMPPALMILVAAIVCLTLSAASPALKNVDCTRPCMLQALSVVDDTLNCFICGPTASSLQSPSPPSEATSNSSLQMAFQRLESNDPDIIGTLHLFHALAENLAGSPEGIVAALYEAHNLMKVGEHDRAISLLHTLRQVPDASAVNMPLAPSWNLGAKVPFDVAVLDNLAHAYDVVGSIAASCNCSSSALVALKRHTGKQTRTVAADFKEQKKILKKKGRSCDAKLGQLSSTYAHLKNFPAIFARVLARDAVDDSEKAVKELHGMAGLFGLLSPDALFRTIQGIVAVLPSASAPSVSLLLLQTLLAALPHGHSCIFIGRATALNLLMGIIESPNYSSAHKDTASAILSLTFACYANAATESRAVHFLSKVLTASSTSDTQKFEAAAAIGRLFDPAFRVQTGVLVSYRMSEYSKQLLSANLVLSSGAGLWQLAALKRHTNSTLRKVATEVLQLALSFSPQQIHELHMPHIERLQDLVSEYSSSKSSDSAVNLLAFGVISVHNEYQYYAWVTSNASRVLLQHHGLGQVQAWLQQLRAQHGDSVDLFMSKNDWKCSAHARDPTTESISASFDRALHVAKYNLHAAECVRLYQDYLTCYSAATADQTMFAKFGGAHSRVHCMSQYRAARMCSFVNEKACHDVPQPDLAPPRHSRIVPARFGPMMFMSPDYYFRLGLGLYGEWSYLEAAGMQAFVPVGGTVVDVGTHVGTMLLAFAEKVGPSGRVVGIEAQRALASIAAHNAALSGHGHVQVINAAVDSSPTTCIMSFESQNNEDVTNYGGFGVQLCSYDMHQACALSRTGCAAYPAPDVSIVNEESRLYTWLPTITIDSLQLQRCDLIKFDVEGWETRALNGAARTISKFKPVLFFEADDAKDDLDGSVFTKSQFVTELLHPLGYVCIKKSFPLFNPNNFNNVTYNLFEEDSFMIHCSVTPSTVAEAAHSSPPAAAAAEL